MSDKSDLTLFSFTSNRFCGFIRKNIGSDKEISRRNEEEEEEQEEEGEEEVVATIGNDKIKRGEKEI